MEITNFRDYSKIIKKVLAKLAVSNQALVLALDKVHENEPYIDTREWSLQKKLVYIEQKLWCYDNLGQEIFDTYLLKDIIAIYKLVKRMPCVTTH